MVATLSKSGNRSADYGDVSWGEQRQLVSGQIKKYRATVN
jgi:hypothetical protein